MRLRKADGADDGTKDLQDDVDCGGRQFDQFPEVPGMCTHCAGGECLLGFTVTGRCQRQGLVLREAGLVMARKPPTYSGSRYI
jgi:hypothetical protein